MPDHKKTNQHLPGMIQRGTLCVFVKPEHSIFYDQHNTGFGRSSVDRRKDGKKNPMLSGRIQKTRREPPAIADVYFNDERYLPNKDAVPNNFRLNDNSITAVLPLAEVSEIRWGKSLHLAFCLQDTTEIAVPRTNPTFAAIPGDVVYAYVLNNASVVIDTYNTHAGIKFKLGVALTPYEHRAGERDEGFMMVTLSPDRM